MWQVIIQASNRISKICYKDGKGSLAVGTTKAPCESLKSIWSVSEAMSSWQFIYSPLFLSPLLFSFFNFKRIS